MPGTVFDLLFADGAEAVRIGGRHRCPLCQARTGLAVRSETYARCFACHYVWNSNAVEVSGFWLTAALNRLEQDCIVAPKNDTEQAKAWRQYLLETRLVDPEVLAESPVGMIPANYDPGDVRRLATERFEAARTTMPPDVSRQDRERIAAKVKAEEEQFETFKRQLREAANCAGWLIFFYGNPGAFLSARLRNPRTKDFRLIRPVPHLTGVFNPIDPAESHPGPFMELCQEAGLGELTDETLVFEGEFNQLTFLSQIARADRAAGRPYISVPSCAMGAAGDWDAQALGKLTANPIVCWDHDEAGKEAVRNLALALKKPLLHVSTPTQGSDMDDFLYSLQPDEVYPALTKLLSSCETCIRPLEAVRDELNTLRRNKEKLDTKTHVEPEVVKTVWRDLTGRGQVLVDGSQVYYFHEAEREVYEVERTAPWLSFLSQYGLLSEDRLTQQVVASTVQRGMREGDKVRVHRTAHYHSATNTAYVNLGGHRVARVTSAGIVEANNGDDGVLFLNRLKEPFKLDLAKLPTLEHGLKAGDTPLSRAFTAKFATSDTFLSEDQCTQLILARLLTMLLPELSESKPIMVLKGERGSGKTTLASKVGWLLEGKDFRPTGADPDPREMETKLVSVDVLVLDNVDDLTSREGGAIDVLCRSASSGEVTRRKLYSDANVSTNFRMTAHLWVSTRTNPLDRPDIADRQILIPLARYNEDDGRSEAEIKTQFLDQRDDLMAELLVRLQHVLGSLERQRQQTYRTPFRMRDFGIFCLRCANDEGWGAEMDAMLRGVSEDQNVTATEGNLLIEVLRLFIGYRAKALQETHEWRGSASKLREELLYVLEKLKLTCPWRTPAQLAYALKKEPSLLKEFGLQIELNKKTKTHSYVLRPTEQKVAEAIQEWRDRVVEPYTMDEVPD